MKKNKLFAMVKDFFHLFFGKRVMRSGAALAYYLTLSVFPIVICLSVILGSYGIDPNSVKDVFTNILPSGFVDTLSEYLRYVNVNSSPALFWAGIALMVTTSSAAFRCITTTMVDIQGRALFSGFWGTLFSFVFSLIFAAVMYLSVFIVVTGRWFIDWLENFLHLPQLLLNWHWIRFIILFAVLFLVIYLIYWFCTPKGINHRVFYGALLTTVAMVVISMIFSTFIEYSTKYSLVYGSLASLVVMMVWLYVCSTVLLGGNLLNFVINKYIRGFYDDDDTGPVKLQ